MTESYYIKNIEDLLKGHFGKVVVLDQTASRLTAPGENYGSLMLKVDLKVKTDTGEELVHAVAKCVPPNKEIQKIFDTKVTFKNEIGWYLEVVPTLQEFQRRNGVENVLNCFPKLYGSRLTLKQGSNVVDNDGVILLENLIPKGYEMGKRLEGFDLQTSKDIIQKMAILHAIPLSIKLQNPDLFKQKITPYLLEEKKNPPDFQQGFLAFLEKEKPEFKDLLGRIKEAFEYSAKGNSKKREPWATIVHNDLWVNNMLIHNSNETNRVIFLDFQVCQYASPVADLVFFLTTSVKLELIKTSFDELVEFYYSEFIKHLKELKTDINLFTYDDFLSELKMEGKNNFVHAIFFAFVILAENATNNDSTKDDFTPQNFLKYLLQNVSQRQKHKICYIIEEFVRKNWI